MADVYDQVQAALEEHLLAFGSLPMSGGDVAVQFENVVFDPPSQSPWWRVSFISVSAVRGAMGENGYSRLDGELKIDIFHPAGVGSGPARRDCDGILKHFKSGTTLVSTDGVEVHIRRAWRSATVTEPEWFMVTARVHWVTHRQEL